jgi:hypothetical protein
VALRNQFVDIATAQSTLQQKHNILNHVLVGDKVQEGRQRLNRLASQVLELSNKLKYEAAIALEVIQQIKHFFALEPLTFSTAAFCSEAGVMTAISASAEE